MKKVLVLCVAALTGLNSLQAQEAAGNGGVRFGLKLSPNMGWATSETKDLEANGSGFGYTFGLLSEFPIGSTGNYRFATGINMNNIMAKWKQEFQYFDAPGQTTKKSKELTTDASLQYLEIPLTVKLMTNEIGYMRYFAQVGFGAAFNIRARADMVQPVYFENAPTIVEKFEELEKENISDKINLFKASLIVGGGLEYNFSGNTSLLAGITYNNGFTNIANFDAVPEKKADLRAHYLELTIGLFL
jgi:opacity protein-like surface antigen